MKTLLKNKYTYLLTLVLVVGLFFGYFGEGIIISITNRDQVLAIKHPIQTAKVESPKDQTSK